MSLVAGLMLGVAGFHLIPHSAQQGGSVDITMYWVIGGLVFMLLLLRLFHFHQRYRPRGWGLRASWHDHASAHDHAHPPQDIGWLGLPGCQCMRSSMVLLWVRCSGSSLMLAYCLG